LSCTRPVNVVCWKRAICLEFMEKVRLLWSLIYVQFLDISKIYLLVLSFKLIMQLLIFNETLLLNDEETRLSFKQKLFGSVNSMFSLSRNNL
jgi:hypothetical protein